MKKGIKKAISTIAILTMTFQIGMPVIPGLQTTVLATDTTNSVEENLEGNIQPTADKAGTTELSESADTTPTEEISRNYEIKEEETWDISANGDGSVMAKWTLKDRTLTISGTGEMKDWNFDSKEDWHDTQYTNAIEKVMINEGITNVGWYAFLGCSSLTSINIPEGVTSIGYETFSGCSSLTSINIPEGVTSIRYGTFSGCNSLKSIVIPKSVTNIGGYAFFECSNLTSIEIPGTVKNIETYTFSGCSNLESINVDENNKYYISENGVLFTKEKTEIICYPAGKKDTKEYIIPESVTNIGSSAFSECSSLTSITIPESVTNIGENAFYECSSLTNIVIPKGVTSIGWGAFRECSSLTSITIPESVTNIGSSAFSGCSSLESIVIPENITSIEDGTFSGCGSLTNIIIPEGVTSIGWGAFRECSSLTSINIPESVTSIEGYAFKECSSLTSINIPESVTSIEGYAFFECSSLTSINIPEGVTSIGDNAIPVTAVIYVQADSEGHRYVEEKQKGYILEGEATNIDTNYRIKEEETWDVSKRGDGSVIAKWTLENRTLTISGTGEMKDWNFDSKEDWHKTQYTNAIEKAIVNEGITNVGGYAFSGFFSGCSNLESINIPESVTSIEDYAFRGCSSLKSINIPKGVTSIGDSIFSGCSSLESINVDVNNKNYMSEDGILFDKLQTEIIKYPVGKKDIENYNIPERVISIGDWAFSDCSSLTSINIPESVPSIGEYAFSGCSGLKSINIPKGVTSIEEGTFSGCSSLTSINIPERVISIGDWAFSSCNSLTSINIPEGVTSIGYRTFNGCSGLESITIPERVTSIGISAFERCSSLQRINVDENNTDYINENGILFNKEKTEIICYPEGKKDIKNYNIPEGVISVSDSAFSGCSSLESITIPESVTSIEEDAIPENTVIYTKSNSEGHRYAEENEQGYILIYEPGDIDGNGFIDITDLLMLKRHLVAGNRDSWKLTGDSLLSADMNENGTVDITDMLMLKRVIVENI